MSIGRRLDIALTTLDIKSKKIVDEFGVSQQYVSNLKKADKINNTIAKIAYFYNIDLNWLYSGKGNMFTKHEVSKETQSQPTNTAPDFIIDDINVLFKRFPEHRDLIIFRIDNLVDQHKQLVRKFNITKRE